MTVADRGSVNKRGLHGSSRRVMVRLPLAVAAELHARAYLERRPLSVVAAELIEQHLADSPGNR